MLDVAHISFAYGTRPILKDITFDVAPGEIVALTGPNGAGKTTLLKVLACLLMQDVGTVRLHGVDMLQRPIKYRRIVGYLSAHNPLYDDMTVEEYLTYRVRLKGERAMRVRRRINEALSVSDLTDVRDTRIGLLSHGYRKRVGLADALSTFPKLLLLDDLLAGLDRPQRAACGAALSAASLRAAVIATGHELDEMLNWCTRVMVLNHGRIAAMFRTGDFDRAELIERIDKLLADPDDAQEVSA